MNMKKKEELSYCISIIEELKKLNTDEDTLCTLDKISFKKSKINSEFVLEIELNKHTKALFVKGMINIFTQRILELKK